MTYSLCFNTHTSLTYLSYIPLFHTSLSYLSYIPLLHTSLQTTYDYMTFIVLHRYGAYKLSQLWRGSQTPEYSPALVSPS